MIAHTRLIPGVVLLGAAVACGSPTSGRPPPEAATPAITESRLIAGGEGVLRGSHLETLTAGITVDGVPVSPTVRSSGEIRFAMPPGRACEVDGRPVAVQAGTLSHVGQLEVPGTVALAVGESRVLDREQMRTLCLQLPAGDEAYVVTALNPSTDPAASPDPLFTVRSWTGTAGPAMVPAEAVGAGSRQLAAHSPPGARGLPAAVEDAPQRYADNPSPFDPRYAGALVGDTLPWVDWWGSGFPNCAGARERIPTINIVVAALSLSGKTVIAYDARSPRGAAWRDPAVVARLGRMAEIMERWAVPAVREAMHRGYQPLRGAGGRWFHVFRADVPGWTIDNNDAPQTACRYSSEVPSTIGPDVPLEYDAQVEYVAALAIHEYAHHAERVYRVRRWGSYTAPMRVSTGWGAAGESWAQTVQETAARLASNQVTAARYAALGGTGSNIPSPDFYLNGYGEHPEQSLWAITPGSRGGYYDQGTRFLMYLRERWGDAPLGSPGDRFFERAQELPRYDVASMAGLVGLSATSALDQWSLAEATDDLVDPQAADARGLPQLRTWVPDSPRPLPSVRVSRSVPMVRMLNVGRGNYGAVYILSEEGEAGKGISLTFENFGSIPFIARLTRVH